MKKFFSFDVFDTLITRKVIRPDMAFDYIEEKIQENYKEEDFNKDIYKRFGDIRRISQRIVSNTYDTDKGRFVINPNYTFDDIYSQIAETQNLSEEIKNILKELEIQCEIELSIPITDNISLLEQLVKEGKHVVLISDMYLQERYLRRILLTHSDVFDNIPIYVSCDYKEQKSNGLLFQIVKEKENATFSKWEHWGDNLMSDVLIPRALGIKTNHFNYQLPLAQQLTYDSYKYDSESLFEDLQPVIDNSCEKLGFYYGGKILVPYVLWVINVARVNNIQDIYFVARDGYCLKEIADNILNNESSKLKTHYLYGSRTVWTINDKNKESVRGYLCQEIDFSKQNLFVDMQGTGRSIERAFSVVEKRIVATQICTFYDKVMPVIGKYSRIMSFSGMDNNTYIELLTRAPHGVTLAYEYETLKEIWKPVLQELDDSIKKKINNYIKGVKRFVEECCQKDLIKVLNENSALISKRALSKLANCTDDGIMSFFYDMPFSQENGEEHTPFAPMISDAEFELYLNENYENYYSWRKWYKGINFGLSLSRLREEYRDRLVKEQNEILSKGLCNGSGESSLKIALYGAGARGKSIFVKIFKTPNVDVVFWIDVNYQKGRQAGLPIEPVEKISEAECDYILIAMADDKKCEGAEYILQTNGIPKEKIITEKQLADMVIELHDKENDS